jgi:hypothetical protein
VDFGAAESVLTPRLQVDAAANAVTVGTAFKNVLRFI